MQLWALTAIVIGGSSLAAQNDRAETEGPSIRPDAAVVCSQDFLHIMEPWIEHRRQQGHRFAFIRNTGSSSQLRATIRRIAADSGRLRYLLLVGDDDPRATIDEGVRSRCVPTHLANAKVNLHWGSEAHIATDNWYADLDDDQIPELAVGRLTADNTHELSVMVDKILRFEKQRPGEWSRRVNVVAGVGGFGTIVDTVIETTAKRFLTDKIPPGYVVSMTYGSWRSPFCPDPRRFRDATIERYNEGGVFWVYLGHGQRRFLDRVRVPGAMFPIFDVGDVPRLTRSSKNPIAITLACYTGAFDEASDCLAEEFLKDNEGPVAVFCGSRITMPYGMGVMSNELLTQVFVEKRQTLGDALLAVKRKMAQGETISDSYRRLLDAVARVVSPKPELLAEELREHVLLFNLLGDPLMRLPQPMAFNIGVPESADAGSQLLVTGALPVAGKCQLELVCRRDRTRNPSPARARFLPHDMSLAEYTRVYRESNDRRWSVQSFTNRQSPFECRLQIPSEAHGHCFVRLWVEGAEKAAVATAPIYIRNEARNAVRASETDPF